MVFMEVNISLVPWILWGPPLPSNPPSPIRWKCQELLLVPASFARPPSIWIRMDAWCFNSCHDNPNLPSKLWRLWVLEPLSVHSWGVCFSTSGDDWRAILAGLRWLQIDSFFLHHNRYLLIGHLPTKSHAELTISFHLVGSISIFHFIVVNIHSNFKWILYLRYCNEFDRLKRSPSTIVIQDLCGVLVFVIPKTMGELMGVVYHARTALEFQAVPNILVGKDSFRILSMKPFWRLTSWPCFVFSLPGWTATVHRSDQQRSWLDGAWFPLLSAVRGLTGWSLGEIVTGWIRSWPLEAQDLVGMCAISKSAKKDKVRCPHFFLTTLRRWWSFKRVGVKQIIVWG